MKPWRHLAWQGPLAVALALMTPSFSLPTVLGAYGLVAGTFAVATGRVRPVMLARVLRFVIDFARDLLVSNLVLARDILSPKPRFRVMLVHVPVADLGDWEKALLAHRITLTPGTLTCGLDEAGTHLVVHVMYPSGTETASALRRPIDILRGTA